MVTQRTQLQTLRRLLSQIELALSSPELPAHPTAHCRELVKAARAIAGDLLKSDKLPAAAALGARGGLQTAKRGSEYFRQLAAKRKTNAGGRPRKES